MKWVIGALLIVLLAGTAFADTIIDGKTFAPRDQQSLTCNEENKVEGRISCRIKLPDSDLLTYWPEECIRASGQDRTDCVNFKSAMLPCKHKNSTQEREGCFMDALGMDQPQIVYKRCLQFEGADRNACWNALAKDIDRLVDFRLDELADKATMAYRRGVTEYLVVGVIKRIDIARQQLGVAQTHDDKMKAIQLMQHDWQLFAEQAQEMPHA